ncbi:preprotein translocase subunit SecE [Staphylococcus aureus]
MAKKESFFKGVKSEMEKTSWPTKKSYLNILSFVVSIVYIFLVFLCLRFRNYSIEKFIIWLEE